jgi:hypothetical protein
MWRLRAAILRWRSDTESEVSMVDAPQLEAGHRVETF